MAQISGVGTSYNLPQYGGLLRSSTDTKTPFLNALGGIANARTEANREFICGQYSDLAAAAQPSVSETDSLTAPTATTYTRAQTKNVTQMFHSKVSVSDRRLSQEGRLTSDGVLTAGMDGLVPSELDFQVAQHMAKHRRDVEYSILLGSYAVGANASEADRTRGIKEALTHADLGNGANVVTLSSAAPTTDDFNAVFEKMAANNAGFVRPVILASAKNMQTISNIYGYAPESRTEGGVGVQSIYTEFGVFPVMWEQMLGNGDVLIVDMAETQLIQNVVPGKGNFFLEPLSKNGASEDYQLFGQLGIDFGAHFAHGLITGIAY